MLSQEDNELLTRVGPGTPAGELLRRYWQPIAVANELTEEWPTKFVRVLCEDLVLFKDRLGRIGLLADHCSHRGASLLYGRVEQRGISCAYHGWLYDCEGNILETPPERNDAIMRSVRHRAYPVQEYIGLLWTYMGPAPAPVIPRYDVWARRDGHRRIDVDPRLDCSWLQPMENAVDPAHAAVLHQELLSGRERPTNTTRGLTDEVKSFEFWTVPFGIMKRRSWKDGEQDDHPLIFPNILRQGDATQVRVPIDDTHTQIYRIHFIPTPDGSIPDEPSEIKYMPFDKEPADGLHPNTRFKLPPEWNVVRAQDHMAWETQGPIADRSTEHLGSSDRGIMMYRNMLAENIEKVRHGQDPMCVIRDPDHDIIDTNLESTFQPPSSVPSRAG